MKNKLIFLPLIALLSFLSCTASAAGIAPDHYMVTYTLKYSYSKDSLDRFWKQKKIPQVLVPVRYAVDLYEITYKGMWLDSSFIMARGVMYVPRSNKPNAELIYDHGTRISVAMKPGIQDLEQVICAMYSVDGYISLFPYYYGLGGGEKEHVYQDSKTEAMAGIYMLKACREIYSKIGTSTSGQLFLTGYSQGGHASMATHKMLESGAFPDIQLTASAPMSGAYDMTGAQSKTMFEHYDHPHYLPYLIISYQYAYHLWPGDIYDIFKPPYNTQIKTLFAQPRVLDYAYIDSILPKVPSEMVLDSLVERFKQDTLMPFTVKLKENGLCNWVPKAPMQMCACYGDNEVTYKNTERAYECMSPNTKTVHKRMFGKHLSHNPCAPFAIIYSKIFFDNIRHGKKHPEHVPAGKGLIVAIGIDIANHQAQKHFKRTGSYEGDAMASRKGKK